MQDGKGVIAKRSVRGLCGNKGRPGFSKKLRASGEVLGRLTLAGSANHDQRGYQPQTGSSWQKFHAVLTGLQAMLHGDGRGLGLREAAKFV